jgi:hypothetical protein
VRRDFARPSFNQRIARMKMRLELWKEDNGKKTLIAGRSVRFLNSRILIQSLCHCIFRRWEQLTEDNPQETIRLPHARD